MKLSLCNPSRTRRACIRYSVVLAGQRSFTARLSGDVSGRAFGRIRSARHATYRCQFPIGAARFARKRMISSTVVTGLLRSRLLVLDAHCRVARTTNRSWRLALERQVKSVEVHQDICIADVSRRTVRLALGNFGVRTLLKSVRIEVTALYKRTQLDIQEWPCLYVHCRGGATSASLLSRGNTSIRALEPEKASICESDGGGKCCLSELPRVGAP